LLPVISRVAGKALLISEAIVFFYNFDAGQPNAAILARLFSEVIYCIWTKRNSVVFERTKCTSQDIKLLFLHRLRVRLKADLMRLGDNRFNIAWNGVAHSISNTLSIFL
jgi:hypothetical protein